MKVCSKCKQDKLLSEFTRSFYNKSGYQSQCKSCVLERQKAFYKTKKGHITKAHTGAKQRSKKYNIPFALTIEYLESIAEDICPVFKIPLSWGMGKKRSNESPSLDRINPKKGYIEGNVVFISDKANRMKNNGDLSDLKKLVAWLENYA